ncbi:MAG: HIT family protein [Tatlockia sp.]|nr:HIT family protein [Tatlockia sp.]
MITPCIIDVIVDKKEATIVFEDRNFIAFLDIHPLFPGHTLVAPKTHYETLYDLPENLVQPFFLLIQRMGKAVEAAMGASGSFIAINNTISQSIPHLHVHVVPRNKKDGLKGFFWPRHRYESEAQMLEIQQKIVDKLKS